MDEDRCVGSGQEVRVRSDCISCCPNCDFTQYESANAQELSDGLYVVLDEHLRGPGFFQRAIATKGGTVAKRPRRRIEASGGATKVVIDLDTGLKIQFAKRDLERWRERIERGEHFLDAARAVIEGEFPDVCTPVTERLAQLSKVAI